MQCFVTYNTGPFLKQPLPSYQCFWLLITDNTPGAEVNPGLRTEKGSQEPFLPRLRARDCMVAPTLLSSKSL
jgi:hypothetical protein